jgi:FAD/FMN-containing dehydrogenase
VGGRLCEAFEWRRQALRKAHCDARIGAMIERSVSRRRFLAAAALAAGGMSPLARGASRGSARHRLRIDGRVIQRGDANYEEWRRGMAWQMDKPARFPELIVQPRDTNGVIAAVTYARRNGLRVAARSGGHHVWANFLRDDGLLVDLSRFKDLQVDAEARRALAGPSIWARNLMRRTLAHGLGFPVAHCATVPLGGFLLGGGLGVNGDEWGTMSCLAVRGAEVVTAAGDRVTVDAGTQPDLWWALRGAGNGFPGVVTRFDLQLFDAPPTVLASTYVFPGPRSAEVAALASAIAATDPRHTEILGIVAIGGRDAEGRNAVICALRVATFAPVAAEGRAVLERVAAEPLARAAMMKMEYVAADWDTQFLDSIDARRGFGFGHYAVDNLWTDAPGEVLPALAAALATSPSPFAHAVAQFKVRTALPVDAALSRSARCYAALYSVWREAALGAAAKAWLRATMAPLAALGRSRYINEIDAEQRPASIAESFSPDAWRRLAALRRRSDPSGVFEDFFARPARDTGADS